MQRIVIITGPPGSGKSTVCIKLAEKASKGMVIHSDSIRAMIKGGYVYPWLKTQEARDQRKLATKNICDVTKNSINLGFDVFIDDVLPNNDLIEEYRGYLGKDTKLILLLPTKEKLIKRLKERGEEDGDIIFERADKLHESFSLIKNKIDWTVIDNSSLTIEETMNIILGK